MFLSPTALYIELIKKTLSFSLWKEPLVAIDTFNFPRNPIQRFLVVFFSWIFRYGRIKLAVERTFTQDQRDEGKIWPSYADTMVGMKRLDNVQFCVETVLQENVEGDFIETGVWRGGTCIFMRAILAAYQINDRKVFVADSFEGLPKPNPKTYPADTGDKHYIHNFLAVSQEQVAKNFQRYGLLDDQVVFLKGWFKDTLPIAPIEKLAIMRLDGDMYESTMDGLNNLYSKLSQGGFCIIDDYGLAGCKKAVDDFRQQHAIQAELKVVDWTGRHWRKE